MSEVYPYFPPTDPWLQIVHADDTLVVADKPSELLSVPGRRDVHRDSLEGRLAEEFGDIHVVHRLDLPTSGLLVFARNADAHRHLSAQFRARTVEKRYEARIAGVPKADFGLVDLPVCKDWPNRPRQKISLTDGKPSLSGWRILTRGENDARVALIPHTGRSHQLRLHMLAIGHPILGDPLYGGADIEARADRLQLHARHLGFMHPDTGAALSFESPPPF